MAASKTGTGQPFAAELPKYALEALRPLLEVWQRAGASERRLRDETLPKEQLAAVRPLPSRPPARWGPLLSKPVMCRQQTRCWLYHPMMCGYMRQLAL